MGRVAKPRKHLLRIHVKPYSNNMYRIVIIEPRTGRREKTGHLLIFGPRLARIQSDISRDNTGQLKMTM